MKNVYRNPRLADLAYLVDIDLKCYEDPWDMEKWRTIIMDFNLNKLVVIRKQHAGVAVWKFDSGAIKVLRLGVKPAYRNYGIGSELLQAIEKSAPNQKANSVVFKIPESLCRPGEPDDVSVWLAHRGYKATRVCRAAAVFCGQVEDAYIFSRRIGV